MGKLNDPRVGFAFHNYADPDQPQYPYQNAEAQSARTGDALLLTEFGATKDVTALRKMMRNADAARMSVFYWTYWSRTPYAVSGEQVPPGALQNGSSFGIVYDLTRPPAGDNVNQGMLDALVRPYPRAVAGTPLRWGYDPTSREFELVYRAAPPEGATLASASLETEVFVPRRQYPQGYRALATGARIVSLAGAPVLRLVTNPGTAEVTVRITPGPLVRKP